MLISSWYCLRGAEDLNLCVVPVAPIPFYCVLFCGLPGCLRRLWQEKEFVVPDEMSKYRLCEIEDGGHFFVHDAEGGDLAKIEAKLKELKEKVRQTDMRGIEENVCLCV